MEIVNLMAGGAVFGIIASSWEKIRSCIWRFFNLFIQDITITDHETRTALIDYLVANFTRVGLYDRQYDAMYDYINSEKRYGYIGYEKFGDHSILFRRGWRPLFFQMHAARKGKENEGSSSPSGRSLLFFRGTFDADRLVADALRHYNSLSWLEEDDGPFQPRRFFLRHVPDFRSRRDEDDAPGMATWQYYQSNRVVGRELDEIGLRPDPGVALLDRLFFPDDVVALIDEVRVWSRSRDLYAEIGIPWKRGWLLHGPGGTGKSALAAAFAHDLDMPIFIFNLGELNNLEFMEEWRKMLTHTPCIALIEDVDNVFHGRKNISDNQMSFGRLFGRVGRKAGDDDDSNKEGKEVERRYGNPLSFDVLLNCLDGVERCEGLFTIITTNQIEQIDPALGQPVVHPDGTTDFISTRPGRIDKAIELTYMRPEVKERMARQILRRFPDLADAFVATLADDPRRETPAQFQERCGQIALKRYWDEQQGPSQPRRPTAPKGPVTLCVKQ